MKDLIFEVVEKIVKFLANPACHVLKTTKNKKHSAVSARPEAGTSQKRKISCIHILNETSLFRGLDIGLRF